MLNCFLALVAQCENSLTVKARECIFVASLKDVRSKADSLINVLAYVLFHENGDKSR